MVINQAERKFDRGVKYFIFRWTIMLVDDDTILCKTTDQRKHTYYDDRFKGCSDFCCLCEF